MDQTTTATEPTSTRPERCDWCGSDYDVANTGDQGLICGACRSPFIEPPC